MEPAGTDTARPFAENGGSIAIIHRFDDVEEKWALAPEGKSCTKEKIRELAHFQEQYCHSEIRMEESP